MTGFGKSGSQPKDFLLDVSVKAVNGRYLEVKIHGPKIYGSLESEIRKLMSSYFKRGTIDVYISRKVFNGSEKLIFNTKLARKWLDGFSVMARELGLEPPQKAEVLFQGPDLIKVEESQTVSSKEKAELFATLQAAADACAKMRSKEGVTLKKDIEKYLSALKKICVQVKKLRKKTSEDLQKKYYQKLEKMNFPGEIDANRLAQEVVILIDKSDISEEVQRLEAHLQALKVLVNEKSESIGKKMDFYAQELLREVNTVGSKSSTSELTQLVVEAKGTIEKYREQVQNVE